MTSISAELSDGKNADDKIKLEKICIDLAKRLPAKHWYLGRNSCNINCTFDQLTIGNSVAGHSDLLGVLRCMKRSLEAK